MNHLSWRYNPQIFIIPPNNTVTANVKLMQHNNGEAPLAIGFYVFETDSTECRRLLMADDDKILEKTAFSKAPSSMQK